MTKGKSTSCEPCNNAMYLLSVSEDFGETWDRSRDLVVYDSTLGTESGAASSRSQAEYWNDMERWRFGHPRAILLDNGKVFVVYYAGDDDVKSAHWARVALERYQVEATKLMTPSERYYWDLVGHLVVPNVLTASEVAAGNEALDYLVDRLQNGTDESSDLLRKHAQPRWLDGTLVWTDHTVPFLLMLPQPHCEPFRKMLAPPQIVRRLRAMCGEGFRLDGGPFFIGGTTGTEVHNLHGAGEPHKPYVAYAEQNGASFTGAVTVSYAFSDAGEGEGGFACVPGSHKSRYPIPPGLRTMDDDMGCVENPSAKAGDAIFFMNGAQTHGAVPWRGVNARRTVLFMYSARSAARQGASRWCLDPDRYWDADTASDTFLLG